MAVKQRLLEEVHAALGRASELAGHGQQVLPVDAKEAIACS